MSPVSTLLSAAGWPDPVVDAAAVAGWPAGDLDRLAALGPLAEVGPAESFPCDACGLDHVEPVEWVDVEELPARAFVVCPDEGAVPVDPATLRRWAVRLPALAAGVAAAVGATGGVAERVPGRVWRLGPVRAGGRCCGWPCRTPHSGPSDPVRGPPVPADGPGPAHPRTPPGGPGRPPGRPAGGGRRVGGRRRVSGFVSQKSTRRARTGAGRRGRKIRTRGAGMGGMGSGRWRAHRRAVTAERCRRVDLAVVVRGRDPPAASGDLRWLRVGVLYLPPGAAYFGCRHCHRLTYASRQGHDPRVTRLVRDPEALFRLALRALTVLRERYDRRPGANRRAGWNPEREDVT